MLCVRIDAAALGELGVCDAAERSRSMHRAGNPHFAAKSHREGATNKGLRSPVDTAARQTPQRT